MHVSLAQYNRLRKRVAKATGRKLPAVHSGPNVNEQRFNSMILDGSGTFEPRHFTITTFGKKYTPDFHCVINLVPTYIEVKGIYRSKKDEKLICERSRLAWEVAADSNIRWNWVWAKYKRGGYMIEVRPRYCTCVRKAFCRNRGDLEKLLKEAKDEDRARDNRSELRFRLRSDGDRICARMHF